MIIHPGGESATFFSKKQFFYLRGAMCNAFCIADTEAHIARRCPLVFEVVEFLITARIIDTPAHGFGGIQTSPSFLLCQYAPILLTGYYSAQRRQAKRCSVFGIDPTLQSRGGKNHPTEPHPGAEKPAEPAPLHPEQPAHGQ